MNPEQQKGKKLERGEAMLVNIMVRVGRAKGNWDHLIEEAIELLRAERAKAAYELRHILRQEFEDANKRIAKHDANPLYWLHRRFEQLAYEIEHDDYAVE